MMEITIFFDKTKWDLTSKSNDGDDSKRPRESSLDDSTANAQIWMFLLNLSVRRLCSDS